MKSAARILIGLTMLGAAAGAAAQSFNQELSRYRAARFDCAEAYRVRIERDCGETCIAAAAERQTRCVAAAERRYAAALRHALRSRR